MVVLGAFALVARAQLPCHYSVAILPNEPCFGGPANVVAINNLGHVLLTADCFAGYGETYLWTGGPALTHIQRPAYIEGFTGTDLNDNDVICGTANATFAGQRGYIYDHGTWTELPPLNPPTGWSGANSINNSGQVVGFRSIGSPSDPVHPFMAFVYSPATGIQDLGVLNGPNSSATHITENGIVAGWTGIGSNNNGDRAFMRVGSTLTILPPIPGGVSSKALCANNDGTVIGVGRILIREYPYFKVNGFAYANSQMQVVPPLSEYTSSLCQGISTNGVVTALAREVNLSDRAFLWWQGTASDPLSLLNSSVLDAIWDIGAISTNGKIAGYGHAAGGGIVSFALTPVPLNAGDVNSDCHTNVNDLLMVIVSWGQPNSPADANHDGFVNVDDLLIVILNWSG